MEASISNKNKIANFAKKYGTLVALVIICVFFSITCPSFLTRANMITVLRQISMLAILGGGVTVIMISGGIDLSEGYGVSILGIACAALFADFGLPVWLATLITLGLGALIGFVNGALVSLVGIPSFICTLCTGFLLTGLNQAYTKGYPISGLSGAFNFFAINTTFGIPNAIYIMLIWLVIVYLLLNHTRFGRNTYAMGGNIEATMMSGVNVKRTQILAYTIGGLGMAVTALVLTSRLGSAHPMSGDNYSLEAVACVYLGSTLFREGEPNLWGTVVGALIMGVLVNGMTLLNLPYYFQDISQGIVILLAVAVASIQRSKKK